MHNFINGNNLIFEESVYIKNNLIKLCFSPIRKFLIDLKVFEKDNLIHNQFIINKQFSKWFIDSIIPLVEDSKINNNSLKNLKSKQQQ